MGDAAEQQDAIEEQKPKSNRLIFIIIGFVILLGIIGAAAMMFLGGGKDGEELLIDTSNKIEPGYMYTFKAPFTGNLSYPDDEFIFSANVTLEIKPEAEASEAEALAEMGIETDATKHKGPYINRVIREEISSKTRMEITSSANREKIQNTIKNRLNDEVLEKAKIEEVFMDVFVN
jgi:flagellar basal body-associated protein FliL